MLTAGGQWPLQAHTRCRWDNSSRSGGPAEYHFQYWYRHGIRPTPENSQKFYAKSCVLLHPAFWVQWAIICRLDFWKMLIYFSEALKKCIGECRNQYRPTASKPKFQPYRYIQHNMLWTFIVHFLCNDTRHTTNTVHNRLAPDRNVAKNHRGTPSDRVDKQENARPSNF